MSAQRLGHSQASRLGHAIEWLTEWRIAHPGEVPAAQLLADAAEAGIATKTLHRARKQLGLRTRQTAKGWMIGDEGLTPITSRAPEAAVPVSAASSATTGPGTAPTQAAPPSLPVPLGAQRRRDPARSQSECSHAAARIVAVLAGSEGDDLGPRGSGTPAPPSPRTSTNAASSSSIGLPRRRSPSSSSTPPRGREVSGPRGAGPGDSPLALRHVDPRPR